MFWGGNEVWLIIVGGVIFVVFLVIYVNMFSYLYILLFLVLFVLFVCVVGLEFMYKDDLLIW